MHSSCCRCPKGAAPQTAVLASKEPATSVVREVLGLADPRPEFCTHRLSLRSTLQRQTGRPSQVTGQALQKVYLAFQRLSFKTARLPADKVHAQRGNEQTDSEEGLAAWLLAVIWFLSCKRAQNEYKPCQTIEGRGTYGV